MQDVYATSTPKSTKYAPLQLTKKRKTSTGALSKEFEFSKSSGSQVNSMRASTIDGPGQIEFDKSAPVSQIILQGNIGQTTNIISEVQVEIPHQAP